MTHQRDNLDQIKILLFVPQYLKKVDILQLSQPGTSAAASNQILSISGCLPQAITATESLKENIEMSYLISQHKHMVWLYS